VKSEKLTRKDSFLVLGWQGRQKEKEVGKDTPQEQKIAGTSRREKEAWGHIYAGKTGPTKAWGKFQEGSMIFCTKGRGLKDYDDWRGGGESWWELWGEGDGGGKKIDKTTPRGLPQKNKQGRAEKKKKGTQAGTTERGRKQRTGRVL